MPALRACTRHALQTLRQGPRHEVLDGDSGLNAIDSNRVAEPLRDARPQLDDGCVHAFLSQRSSGDRRAHRAPFRGALVRAVRERTRGRPMLYTRRRVNANGLLRLLATIGGCVEGETAT
jgi:hypothetical protein